MRKMKSSYFQKSKSSDLVFVEHDVKNTEVCFPMPLYALLAVLFQTLLLGVDLDQGREPSQHVFQLQFLLAQLGARALQIDFVVLKFHLVAFLQLLDYAVIVQYGSGQLVLVLFDHVGLG